MATSTKNVPREYLQEGGKKFQIGMDARFRGDLIRSVTGDTNDEMFIIFDRDEAIEILTERDWLKFLPPDVYDEVTSSGRRTQSTSGGSRRTASRGRVVQNPSGQQPDDGDDDDGGEDEGDTPPPPRRASRTGPKLSTRKKQSSK